MRAGLTGLGLVFVATLAASVLFAPADDAKPKEPSEPLAQLGVAPGPEKNGSATFDTRTTPAAEVLPAEQPPLPAPDPTAEEAVPLPQSAPPDSSRVPLPAVPRDGSRPIV